MSASGPLVARWRMLERAPVQAGALQLATIEVENAGTAAWRTRGVQDGLFLELSLARRAGQPIVWDGVRTALERAVGPGETLRQELALRAPIPPGRYRLAVDLVEEHRFWLAELGNPPLEEDVEVAAAATPARRTRSFPRAPSRRTTGMPACASCTRRAIRGSRRRHRAERGSRDASGARAVRTRRRPPSAASPSARLPLASAAARAELTKSRASRRTVPSATSRRCSTAGS